jgi:hypothetical protein
VDLPYTPITLAIVEKLRYDLMLGMDFFTETEAIVDVKSNTFKPARGLNNCAYLTTTGEYVTSTEVKIPPFSEVVFSAKAKAKLCQNDYMLEDKLTTSCPSLIVAGTI